MMCTAQAMAYTLGKAHPGVVGRSLTLRMAWAHSAGCCEQQAQRLARWERRGCAPEHKQRIRLMEVLRPQAQRGGGAAGISCSSGLRCHVHAAQVSRGSACTQTDHTRAHIHNDHMGMGMHRHKRSLSGLEHA